MVGALLAAVIVGVTDVSRTAPLASDRGSMWRWKGMNVRYRAMGLGNSGPSVVCIHGFGANADHWRQNVPALAAAGYRTFAIDLLGYGYSDKPDPGAMASVCGEQRRGDAVTGTDRHPLQSGYNVYTWADQILDFVDDVVADDGGVAIVCNSVGSVVGLQAALEAGPSRVKGVFLLNPSLRLLHVRKQNPLQVPFTSLVQTVLRETPVGSAFFSSLAKPSTIRTVLGQAYAQEAKVTDELIDAILTPGLQPGAAKVFLDFISYSAGPLPEDLLAKITDVPIWIGWGAEDPWEPIDLGRRFGEYDSVKRFIALPGLGHCPMDESPEVVNPLIKDFVAAVHDGDR